MFYSFVYVQLNVFLFSQILQGHVQQALSPSSFWLMRKVNHKLVGKKKIKGKRKTNIQWASVLAPCLKFRPPDSSMILLWCPLWQDTLQRSPVTCFRYEIKKLHGDLKTAGTGSVPEWEAATNSHLSSPLSTAFFTGPQGYMRHDHHHHKDSFWARAPPGCIRRLSCRRITNAVSRCWVNKYSCWSGVLQFLETSTFGPQEAFQLPSLQINPRLLLSKPIPRVLQIRVFLLSQRKNESGVLFSLCLEESVIMQVTIFNIDILT